MMARLNRRMGLRFLPAALMLGAGVAAAGTVVLDLTVAPKGTNAQVRELKVNLPAGIRTNDILNLGGLQLGYDVRNDLYYVFKNVEIAPGSQDLRKFRVELRDIWTIPEEQIAELAAHTDHLAGLLKGTAAAATADQVRGEIVKNLGVLRTRQADNAVKPGIRITQHVRAYEANAKLLTDVKKDVGRLENLVMGSGKDPGKLLGEVRNTPKPNRDAILPRPDDLKTVTWRITVNNPSPTEKRRIQPFRQELPPEIGLDDVFPPEGYEVGIEPRTGATWVGRDVLEIEPTNSVTFDVKIRDKWNVNAGRIDFLAESASNLLTRVGAKEEYRTVRDQIAGLAAELGAIRAELGPVAPGADYVAFFRRQADRLDIVDQKINRIQVMLRPLEKSTKMGLPVKPPTLKTTWGIIYIILGFLALMSLLFFLRWFGRTKAEDLTGEVTREK